MRNYSYLILICLFSSVLLFFLLIWPKYQSLSSLNKEISQKTSEFQSQEKYFQDLQKTSEELKKYQDSLLKIDFALPPNLSLPEFFNFLQKASSQSGLSLKKIGSPRTSLIEEEIEEEIKEAKIKESKIDLTLSGDYPSLKNFLQALEKSARLIEVEKISFTSPEKKENFDFDLTIKVYSY